ncbi:Fur family transcriptional regulator [Williamsoniiplasma lucivorax]|uniref:Fur family transcriptional regulator n=1 Tax=Williamsoniiplasma lucivorax TaxID=209274 RepID=A0A2S5RFQ2_9MOLU|nr:transcriptional repressor [Williamsoniiplasma lucivorax]PPE06130.1 Fur family transcriptional regulator [Williamsoniiplasma lucivorax]
MDAIAQKKYDQIIGKLKKDGIRVTNIRSEVIKAIITTDHPTINDIIKIVEKTSANTNVMSVYNTLNLLLEKHLLFANTFNGKQIVYEIQDVKSVHLKCDSCLAIQHLDDQELQVIDESRLKQLAQNHQMTFDHFKIEIHGLCQKCYQKAT